MFFKKVLFTGILAFLSTSYLTAQTKTVKLDDLGGNWHLRIMNGMEVRKARAILDFDTEKMILSGFDSCNRISGALKVNGNTNITSRLTSTRMGCREPIHTYVSKRLHETVKEGFSVTKATRDGVEGIIIKSSQHELFFKKMG